MTHQEGKMNKFERFISMMDPNTVEEAMREVLPLTSAVDDDDVTEMVNIMLAKKIEAYLKDKLIETVKVTSYIERDPLDKTPAGSVLVFECEIDAGIDILKTRYRLTARQYVNVNNLDLFCEYILKSVVTSLGESLLLKGDDYEEDPETNSVKLLSVMRLLSLES